MMIKNSVLFVSGFCLYITIEVLVRGFSYPLMGILGGLAVIILDKINNHISWDIDLAIQALAGSALITGMELAVGLVAKYTELLPVMWDYSGYPLNLGGIVCLPFAAIWALLSIVAIFLADAINYYIFAEEPVPHYKLFNVISFKMREKGA